MIPESLMISNHEEADLRPVPSGPLHTWTYTPHILGRIQRANCTSTRQTSALLNGTERVPCMHHHNHVSPGLLELPFVTPKPWHYATTDHAPCRRLVVHTLKQVLLQPLKISEAWDGGGLVRGTGKHLSPSS